jgi:glycosyltransferase involved in cell wall biosynthesis
MRRDGATVLHGPANALPLLPVGLPEVMTVHDLAIYDHPEWFPSGQWLATHLIVPASVRRARAIICPSEATRRALGRHFDVAVDRVRVIPHGVEPAFGQAASRRRLEEVKVKYALPDRYLLQVGTIQPRKNYLTTLRAIGRIPPAQRIPLVAIGNFGWGYQPVVDCVAQLRLGDWVRFVGYAGLAELPALYQMATAAVYPSLDEGFGLPVLEAFAAGIPLAASTAGAIPEVAGQAALLCEAEDDATLARNLQRIVADEVLRQRLIAAGRSRAASYTWPASVDAHTAVYQSVAA